MAELPAFESTLAHLLAITDLGKLLAGRLVYLQASRRGLPTSDGGVRKHDLAIEIARLLGGAADANAARERASDLDGPIDAAFDAFELRLVASLRAGEDLPMARLVRTLGLSRLEERIVIALAAAEIDTEITRAYFAAFDDGRRALDVSWLALLVGGGAVAKREEVVQALSPGGALRRHRLVLLGEGPHGSRSIRLADRVVALLRGDRALDDHIAIFCKRATPPPLASLVIDRRAQAWLERALDLDRRRPARVLLWGLDGIGKATLVEAVAVAAGRAALRVDLRVVLGDPARAAEYLATCGREAALADAVLVVDAAGIAADLEHEVTAKLGVALAALPGPVAIVAERALGWLPQHLPELVEIEVAGPTYRERAALWTTALGPAAVAADVELVAGRYSFGAGSIARAARRAVTTAHLRDPEHAVIALDDLVDASRQMFSNRLGSIAQRIPAGFTWDDLVLPNDTHEQLREVVRFARRRPMLLEEWGFGRKLPYGRGISAILAGPPGTGKTMVAQLLAHELGYDLYRIDLSQVVNKYIGETEKNLARIFSEAENSHAVLFFDEADSMFAKRTEVRSSNDRYANLEVNYLLQRMETFDGVTLLATNIEQGIDEAFKRRVRFTVQFELPDEGVRVALWKSMFPQETPLAADIDWTILAARFEMAGGYIKKAALRAALAAADAGRAIAHADLLRAATQEYREMGRVTTI